MRAALAQMASIGVIVFAACSMLSVGLAYRLREILRPLREARAVLPAMVANFVLVPLLAVGIERVVPMDAPLALGLLLLAGAAGSPFFIKLARAARSDLALSAALLLLVIPATVVFLPFYVPLAMAHPALRELSYTPSSIVALGVPLLSTLFVPLLLGLAIKGIFPGRAGRLVAIGSRVATIALVLVVAGTFGAHLHEAIRIVRSGVVTTCIMLTAGAFGLGFVVSRPERRLVLGLGTAQRNIAGAMVIASRDFEEPEVLVMVTTGAVVALLVLFSLAFALSRRTPHVGLPTSEAASA